MDIPEGNIVTGPASLWIAPAGGEPFEGWTSIGFTDGGIQFTPVETGSFVARIDRLIELTHGFIVDPSCDLTDLLLGYGVGDATEGRDTTPCSGSGGRWSDLLAQIDELVDGEQA